MKETEALTSVRNAVKILRTFSQDVPELGISEISRRLNIPKSSVARIIWTLCEEELLSRNPVTRKYRLGLPAFEIGSVFYHEMEICQVALPILKRMAKSISGVIQLVMYDSGGVVYLIRLPEEKDLKIVNTMGKRVPAHGTAAGKLLLAFQDSHEIERILSGRLKPFTIHTITSPDKLRSELEKIRNAGHALSDEEFSLGVYAVAIPVYDDYGTVIAALSVTRHKVSTSVKSNSGELIQEMKIHSRLITEQLGKAQKRRHG